MAGVSRGWVERCSLAAEACGQHLQQSLLSPAHVPMATSNGKVAVLGASQSAPDPSTRRSQDDVLAGELLLHQGGLRHQVQHHDQGQKGVVQGSGDKCWSWKASLHCCEKISIYRIKKLAPAVLLWHWLWVTFLDLTLHEFWGSWYLGSLACERFLTPPAVLLTGFYRYNIFLMGSNIFSTLQQIMCSHEEWQLMRRGQVWWIAAGQCLTGGGPF